MRSFRRRAESSAPDEGVVRIGDLVLREGDLITIDGSTGAVTTGDVPLVAP